MAICKQNAVGEQKNQSAKSDKMKEAQPLALIFDVKPDKNIEELENFD